MALLWILLLLLLLNTIIISGDERIKLTFSFISSLGYTNESTHLDLSFKNIDSIDKDAFKQFTNVDTMNLNANYLTFLNDSDLFDHLVHLKCLILANNKLQGIHKRVLTRLANLHYLAISIDFFKQLDLTAFNSLLCSHRVVVLYGTASNPLFRLAESNGCSKLICAVNNSTRGTCPPFQSSSASKKVTISLLKLTTAVSQQQENNGLESVESTIRKYEISELIKIIQANNNQSTDFYETSNYSLLNDYNIVTSSMALEQLSNSKIMILLLTFILFSFIGLK